MHLTEYAVLDDEALITYVELRDNSTRMEIELAQRLRLALDLINERNADS